MSRRRGPAERAGVALAVLVVVSLMAGCKGNAHRLMLQGEAQPRIANGVDAPCDRYPYMVSVRNRENEHKCGGVLVHPEWVMTAAHCVDPANRLSVGASPVMVIGACRLGDTEEEDGVELTVPQRTIIHESWTGSVVDGHDIALMKLASPSSFTPAALPTAISTDLTSRPNFVALGWGNQEDGETPVDEPLQQATSVEVVRNTFCNADTADGWEGIIQPSMLCAFSFIGEEVCRGDSGGPLLEPFRPDGDASKGEPSLDLIVGITSFGEDSACGNSTKPNVFTRVSSFRQWLDDKMGEQKSPPSEGGPPSSTNPNASPEETKDSNSSSTPLKEAEPTPKEQERIDEKLLKASRDNDVEAATKAISRGADVDAQIGDGGETPLIAAASSGATEALELLLSHGADVDATDRSGRTALYKASWMGRLAAARTLLESGARVNEPKFDGATPLWVAAYAGHADVLAALLEEKAEVNTPTFMGNSPLAAASLFAHAPVVELLLAAGADVNRVNVHRTAPLHLATVTPGPDGEVTVRALLASGADVEARNDDGWSPLIFAARYGNVRAAEILVAAGADVRARDDGGESAAEVVCSCLLAAGAEDRIQCRPGGCDTEGTADELLGLLSQ